jgi:hypothetical protein
MNNILKNKKNVYSQNGEDGIIEYIFNKLNIKEGNFIEFGAWDGKYLSNTFKLFLEKWSGIYIESDNVKFKDLQNNFINNNKITTINSMVGFNDNDNLDRIIDDSNHPNKNFDIISIDVDGLDYNIFKAMNKYLPKVICIEVNAGHSPLYNVEIPINISQNNVGQSLKVICDYAATKDYFPLCYTGNLFLVKNEYKELFKDDVKELQDMYYEFLGDLDLDAINHLINVFLGDGVFNDFKFENNELRHYVNKYKRILYLMNIKKNR